MKEYRGFTVNADMRKYNETKKFPKYGYRYKDGKMELEIDPYAAKNVRKIFQLICDGKSFKEAAAVMTEEGVMYSGNYIDKLWGRKVRKPNEAWKRDQIKRIVYNLSLIHILGQIRSLFNPDMGMPIYNMFKMVSIRLYMIVIGMKLEESFMMFRRLRWKKLLAGSLRMKT